MIDYKYNENEYLDEIRRYIDSTYSQHYSGKYQATDMIIDAGHGTGFCIGNIMKYAKRYGKKNGLNKKDLLKIIHYAMIQLYVHDEAEQQEASGVLNLSPPPDSIFNIDYRNQDKIEQKSLMTCYKNNPLNDVDDMCYACDCWKSKRGI